MEKLHLQYDWINERPIEKAINQLIDENEYLIKRLNSLFDLYATSQQENEKIKEAVKGLVSILPSKNVPDLPTDNQYMRILNQILK